jgi:hypothetical protein
MVQCLAFFLIAVVRLQMQHCQPCPSRRPCLGVTDNPLDCQWSKGHSSVTPRCNRSLQYVCHLEVTPHSVDVEKVHVISWWLRALPETCGWNSDVKPLAVLNKKIYTVVLSSFPVSLLYRLVLLTVTGSLYCVQKHPLTMEWIVQIQNT